MKNNLDFTTVPRSLIYRERKYLDDFEVEEVGSLNNKIYEILYREFSHYSNFEQFITSLFNHAYYICTAALADSHPDRRFGTFNQVMFTCMNENATLVCAIYSIVLLQIQKHEWDTSPAMKRLAESFYREMRLNGNYMLLYNNMKVACDQLGDDIKLPLQSEFMPRKINRGLLKNLEYDWHEVLETDEEKMLHFIIAIGKDEEEQLIITDFLRGVLSPIFDDKEEAEYCFNDLKRIIYNHYHKAEEEARNEAEIEADIEEQVLKDIEYDEAKKSVETLKKEKAELEAKVQELEAEKTALQEKVKLQEQDIVEEPVQIPAAHAVRIKTFLEFITRAGVPLKRPYKTKVASLISTVLDIPTKTCKNVCSDSKLGNIPQNHISVTKINDLLHSLGIEWRLKVGI